MHCRQRTRRQVSTRQSRPESRKPAVLCACVIIITIPDNCSYKIVGRVAFLWQVDVNLQSMHCFEVLNFYVNPPDEEYGGILLRMTLTLLESLNILLGQSFDGLSKPAII